MSDRWIVKLERLVVDGGRKDRWFIRPRSRRGRWHWFDANLLPPVGDRREAIFELERIRGGWRVLRIVEDDA